jgi:hypothetical protein
VPAGLRRRMWRRSGRPDRSIRHVLGDRWHPVSSTAVGELGVRGNGFKDVCPAWLETFGSEVGRTAGSTI